MRLDQNGALYHLPQPPCNSYCGRLSEIRPEGRHDCSMGQQVSMSPPLIMVSITPSRYTLELVREYGEFAVNIVGRRLEKAAYSVFGSRTGRGMDKIAESGVKARKGEKTRVPILEDATVSLECRLVKTVEAGDHVLVVGEVVNAFKFSGEQPLHSPGKRVSPPHPPFSAHAQDLHFYSQWGSTRIGILLPSL